MAATGYTVLISRNFPPLVGGMEKLNFHLASELAVSNHVLVIGPAGSSNYAKRNLTVATCPTSIFLFLPVAAIRALAIAATSRLKAKNEAPKLVIAGSGVTALIAWILAKTTGSRFGVYLHGLDIIADSMIYQRFFVPMIRSADFWITNSTATKIKAIEAGIPEHRITIIPPGVEIPKTLPDQSEVERWRKQHNIGSGPVLLSVGRLTKRKGLKQFILYSLPLITKAHPNTKFVVVGSEPKNALQKNSVGVEALKTAAEQVNVQANVRFLGSVADDTLSLLYRCADVHVFPIIATPGDMEGFGMVAIEAAARGVPTVAFAEGGVTDAVNDGTSGYLITPGDYQKFANTIVAIISKTTALSPIGAQEFAAGFAWQNFGKKVRKLMNSQEKRWMKNTVQ